MMSVKAWRIAIVTGLCLAVLYIWSVVGVLFCTPVPIPASTHVPQSYPTHTPKPIFTPTPDYGDDVGACLICRRFIKNRLKAPRDAKWSLCLETATSFNKKNKSWIVTSYVDSPNEFGVMLRLQYVCKVKHLGDDKWRLLNLNFRE